MTDERWAAVWVLFHTVRELPAEQRTALLAASSLDGEIREEVVALLESSVSSAMSGSFPARPAAGPVYAAGREFGRYVILGAIGQGGFGRIYAARDKDLGRTVALKVLSCARPGGKERLIEEARSASALNHPNIVTVYETISVDDRLGIVMEFVDGLPLRQILLNAAGPLPLDTVVRYGRQAAQALAAAHQAGIIHRDVKPENILVRKDDYVKLVDFGLATGLAALSGGGEPLTGTLRYISPEQLRGEPCSAASDVFSLGLVLYELAAGAHAFPGTTPLETAEAIATDRPAPLSQKPGRAFARLDRLLQEMLSNNPLARPSAAAVTQSLEEIASIAGRRVSRTVAFGFAAVIVLAGTLAYGFARWTRKPPPFALRLSTRPLTGDAGQEMRPSLSPDGLSVVYGWRESPSGVPVTFVREIGSDEKTALPIQGPYSWLPDNRRIGFLRQAGGLDALCVISKDGTGEDEVLRAKDITHFQWSSDGKWIIYSARPSAAENHAIFLFETSTRQSRPLTFPPATATGDKSFAISPDGRQLAFRRSFNAGNSDVFVTSLPQPGVLRRITFHETAGDAPAWTRDGRAIISSASRGANSSLWLHPLGSPDQPTRLTELGMEAVGIQSALSRDRLAWLNRLEDANVWRVPVSGGKAVRIISSTMRDGDVASSRLGPLAFRSDRSGFSEIWISGKDGESQKMVTDFEGFTGSPQWSPDGRRLAFGSRRGNAEIDIYVMDCDPSRMRCGKPVQVTDHPAADTIPSWSADGSWIYFASQRSGEWQVWRTAARGNHAEPMQMTQQGGYYSAESDDGAWLYYSRVDSPKTMGVWRKPLPGAGNPRYSVKDPGEMVIPLQYLATGTWVLAGREIFYSTPGRGFFAPGELQSMALWAFDLQTRRTRMVHRIDDVPLARGLALSSDKKSLFFVRLDRSESNVMIADYEVVK